MAPARLSIFDEPDSTMHFCNSLRWAVGQYNTAVTVDLDPVTFVRSDAILLMHAIIRSGNGWRTNVGGNLPANGFMASKFKVTGFFNGFAVPPAQLPPPQGLILNRSNRVVYSEVAAEIVRFAMSHSAILASVANCTWSTLVELMTNTRGHAAGVLKEGEISTKRRAANIRPWFAGVYCENQRAHFTFIDLAGC